MNIITHLALGGATETVLTSCRLADRARLQCSVLSGITSPEEVSLEAQAREDGIELHHLPRLNRAIRPLADWRAYQDLVVWLKRYKPDIVHTHGSKAGFLARMAASAAGVPIIIHTVHGWGHHERQNLWARRFYVSLERRASRITDRLIAVSAANRDKGLQDGIGYPDQYEVIHSCINIQAYRDVSVDTAHLRDLFGIPKESLVVGTIGRLAAQKAPDDFVRMATLVHAQRPETHFVWIGGGPLEEKMHGWIAEAGLTPFVHLLGYRNDVPEMLRLMDVFVLTSLWEGLPRVFAQAMCASLPIVATRVDGAPEAVTDGENGYLVNPQDPRASAERVLSLLTNADLRCVMGQCGLDRVDPQFNEQEMVRCIEDTYLSLAHKKGLLQTLPLKLEIPL